MNKKGQAAMEFLMTYGWAILVVLIALGALFYLGVFNPSTPNACAIGAPFSCIDIRVDASDNDGDLVIGASGIQDGADLTVTGDCAFSEAAPGTGAGSIDEGENTIETLVCANAVEGDKVSGDIEIAYTLSGSDISHTATGSWSATVEA